jgi:uncharacterized membrane protein YraQ (UPF0718 family)
VPGDITPNLWFLIPAWFLFFVGIIIFLDALERGAAYWAAALWGVSTFLVVPPFLYVMLQSSQYAVEKRSTVEIKNRVLVVIGCILGLTTLNMLALRQHDLIQKQLLTFWTAVLWNGLWLAVGCLVSLLLRYTGSGISRTLFSGKNPVGYVVAVGLGLVFPASLWGTAPIARRLLLQGAALPVVLLLTFCPPILNSLLVWSLRIYGLPQSVSWVALTFGGLGAILTSLLSARTLAARQGAAEGADLELPADSPEVPGTGLPRAAFLWSVEFAQYAKFLLIGAALAAFVQLLVPKQNLIFFAQEVPGSSPLSALGPQVLTAMILGVTASPPAPSAAALSGLLQTLYPPHALVALLLHTSWTGMTVGPAVLAAYKPKFGWTVLGMLSLFSLLVSLGYGFGRVRFGW